MQKLPPVIQIGLAACVYFVVYSFSPFLNYRPFLFTSAAETVELKPNDAVYVKIGKKVYVEQCASCHGVNLEGQDGWRNTKVDIFSYRETVFNFSLKM